MSASKNINAEKIQGNLSINSVSATTISGNTFYGDGSNLTNIVPTLTDGQIFIGDGGTVSAVDVTGDININTSGVTTIQPDSVTYDKIQDVTQKSLLGSTITSGGTLEEIPLYDQYISTGVVTSLLESDSNWTTSGSYTGTTITGTYQGQMHSDSNYWFTAVDDNDWIRLPRQDYYITGGDYNSSTLTLNRRDGNDIVITGFTSGGSGGTDTNSYVTGFTYNGANTFTISRNDGLSDLTTSINTVTGLTVNGNLTVTGGSVQSPIFSGVGSTEAVFLGTAPDLHDIRVQKHFLHATAGVINVGQVVILKGWDDTQGVVTVELADSTVGDARMPAIGIVTESGDTTTQGLLVSFGYAQGLNTSGYSLNDSIYVSETLGELTNIKPTGDTRIQRIGQVIKVDSTDGIIEVISAGRSNDLPQLEDDKFWLGSTTWLPTPTTVNDLTNKTTPVNGDKIFIWDSINGNHASVYWSGVSTTTGFNLTGGTGIFSQKSGDNLEFKSLTSTGNTVGISTNSNTINLESNLNFEQLGVTAHTHSGSDVILSSLEGSTYSDVQDMNDVVHSSGVISGGEITNPSNGFVNVAGGTGLIRSTDSEQAELFFFDWSGVTNQVVSVGETLYVGVDYNSGSPQVVFKTTDTWTYTTNFPLGVVINEDDTEVHTHQWKHIIGGHGRKMNERTFQTMPLARDVREGGLILGSGGTRNVTVTGGAVWDRFDKTIITDKDTSVSDTFDSYYSDGTLTGHTKITGVTQVDNTQYDDGSGTLLSLSGSYYTNRWFYVETDDDLVMYYGNGQYLTVDEAELESAPTNLPDRLRNMGLLIGRIIVQEGTDTFAQIDSAFRTIFTPSSITSHGSLSNLQGGGNGEYYHLTQQQHNDLTSLNTFNSFSSTTSGQTVITPSSLNDTIIFSGINIDVLTDNTNKIITLSTTSSGGETNTASNLGGGEGVFAQKNGVDLEFKSITSTGGTVTISSDSNTVNIESSGGSSSGVNNDVKIFTWFNGLT